MAMVEMRSQLAIERAGLVTLHLQPARRSSIPTKIDLQYSRPLSSVSFWQAKLFGRESKRAAGGDTSVIMEEQGW